MRPLHPGDTLPDITLPSLEGQTAPLAAIAIDAQGPDAAQPRDEKPSATCTNLAHADNRLSELFQFKTIPNDIFIDKAGISRKQVWAVDTPERYCAGAVDFDWRREQIEKGS